MKKKTFDSSYSLCYNSLFNMLKHVGDELNDRKNRFDKSDLIESMLEMASQGRLMWVDEIGFDHISRRGVKFEVKSQKFALFTEKGTKKKRSKKLKLTNTLSNAEVKKINSTADYLIIVDSGAMAMAIMPYREVVNDFTKEVKDGFVCQVPSQSLEYLWYPTDNKPTPQVAVRSYADSKMKLMKEYTQQFLQKREN
jgi:hypothetical protein